MRTVQDDRLSPAGRRRYDRVPFLVTLTSHPLLAPFALTLPPTTPGVLARIQKSKVEPPAGNCPVGRAYVIPWNPVLANSYAHPLTPGT